MQSDANSPNEILRQKQDAKMKRRKIARNKNEVAKRCTWEAATDLNPNFEILRQNKVQIEKKGNNTKQGQVCKVLHLRGDD
jgi:hypothetical protein